MVNSVFYKLPVFQQDGINAVSKPPPHFQEYTVILVKKYKNQFIHLFICTIFKHKKYEKNQSLKCISS